MIVINSLPEEWERRLDELAALERGWMDGKGLPISKGALETARSFLANWSAKGADCPRIHPAMFGGIHFELDEPQLNAVISRSGKIRLILDEEGSYMTKDSVNTLRSSV